jgi:ABC-type multidrug transport system ATPase subunit
MLLEGVNLVEAAKRPIGTYSGGMKQRIGIAQALLNDPKVLIFDEPTVGLDPEERVRFRNLISDLASNRIIILSSHIVSDIETIADEVAIMRNGTLIMKGSQVDVMKETDGKVFETIIDNQLLGEFKNKYHVVNTMRQKEGIRVRYLATQPAESSTAMVASLEDAYLFLSKKGEA